MNDRIKQLAEQAGSTHKQNLGVYQFYSNELDQFAELIIRECVQVCKQEWYDLNNQTTILDDTPRNIGFCVGQKAGVITCINSVVKHFERFEHNK